MDKCACVILNYNDADTTINQIRRIENYNNISNVIIVDNCSSDDSFARLNSYRNQKISVFETDKNGGYGYGNNYGIIKAYELGCTYAVISNPDVYFSDKLVGELLSVISSDSNCAIVSSIQLDINNSPINEIAWKNYTKFDCIFMDTRLSLLHNKHYSLSYLQNSRCTVDCIPGAFLLVDIEKFLSVGGYDTSIFLYFEETTLGYRMKEKGYKTILVTDASYRHEHSVSIDKTYSSSIEKLKLLHQSKQVVLEKYLNANRFELWFSKRFDDLVVRRRKHLK